VSNRLVSGHTEALIVFILFVVLDDRVGNFGLQICKVRFLVIECLDILTHLPLPLLHLGQLLEHLLIEPLRVLLGLLFLAVAALLLSLLALLLFLLLLLLSLLVLLLSLGSRLLALILTIFIVVFTVFILRLLLLLALLLLLGDRIAILVLLFLVVVFTVLCALSVIGSLVSLFVIIIAVFIFILVIVTVVISIIVVVIVVVLVVIVILLCPPLLRLLLDQGEPHLLQVHILQFKVVDEHHRLILHGLDRLQDFASILETLLTVHMIGLHGQGCRQVDSELTHRETK